jgi:hypothetical protein
MVRSTDRIVIPGDLRPGRYTLALRVGAWQAGVATLSRCEAPGLAADRMLVRFGEVEVLAPPLARGRRAP